MENRFKCLTLNVECSGQDVALPKQRYRALQVEIAAKTHKDPEYQRQNQGQLNLLFVPSPPLSWRGAPLGPAKNLGPRPCPKESGWEVQMHSLKLEQYLFPALMLHLGSEKLTIISSTLAQWVARHTTKIPGRPPCTAALATEWSPGQVDRQKGKMTNCRLQPSRLWDVLNP